MSPSHFRELEVWRLAMDLARSVYALTALFPRDERFGLTAQIQKSAVSIPSNIAEGNARGSTRDYARFVSIALGSAAELQTQLLIAEEVGLATAADASESLELCDRVGRMLLRLHQSLQRKLAPTTATAMHNPESRVPSPESR